MRFSTIEKQELIKAWVAISLAFAFVLTPGLLNFEELPKFFAISAFTVGIGFLFHEIAHKLVAQKYGCWAEFRADNKMLLFAVVLAAGLGVVFAAPGAVFIKGNVTKERNGKISIAGPLTNIGLALVFLGIAYAGIFKEMASIGFMINAWLAVFNLLPLPVLDGMKVLNWNKKIYVAAIAFASLLVVLQQLLLPVV